ncbi:MAG: DUF3489 domain-containing protein [Alphaproteobacteria bacterium]
MAKPATRVQMTTARNAASKAKPRRKAAVLSKEPTVSQTANSTSKKAFKAGGKLSGVLDLLGRKDGASIADLQKATGWLPHSVRAALTGFRKQGVGITRSKNGDGVTIYTASQA